MRSNIYILFGFLAGIAVVCIAVFTVIVATSHAVSPSDFPVYAYSEYIDRTSSMTFTADGGAQLYEAEKAALENAKAEHNVLASGESAVGGMEEGSVIRYTVVSDSVCTVRLFLSLCYSPASGSDSAADSVLSVRCNGAEAGIRSASVYACGSPYDFRENGLCAAELKKGENEIEVRIKTGGVTADYLLLVPVQERTSSDPVIGNPSEPFDSSGGEQRFESESAKNENVVAFYDSSASELASYMALRSAASSSASPACASASFLAASRSFSASRKAFSSFAIRSVRAPIFASASLSALSRSARAVSSSTTLSSRYISRQKSRSRLIARASKRIKAFVAVSFRVSPTT